MAGRKQQNNLHDNTFSNNDRYNNTGYTNRYSSYGHIYSSQSNNHPPANHLDVPSSAANFYDTASANNRLNTHHATPPPVTKLPTPTQAHLIQHQPPQRAIFSFRHPINPATNPAKVSFDLPAQKPVGAVKKPAWTARGASISAEEEKRAKRAERFGSSNVNDSNSTTPPQQGEKKHTLYKPEPGFLSAKPVSYGDDPEQMDFLSFADFGESKSDGGEDDKKEDSYEEVSKDRDALDLVYDLPQPVWADDDRIYSSNLTEMFNQEVMDYVNYIAPTVAEHSVRHLTIERLRFVVKKIWPTVKCEVFGSFSTKLYLPTSDVDIVLIGANLKTPQSLYELSVALRDHNYTSKMEIVPKAKVPIIKYIDALTSFHVDVSINMVGGCEAAKIVAHFLNEPNGVGDAIKGLMYLLKQFLLARYLNEPFTGGCGSYALLIIVSAFVKMHPMVQTGSIDAKQNLGILFIEFLELYGKSFNYHDVGISCSLEYGPEYFLKRNCRFERRMGFLTVLDPQDARNDVGSGAYNFFAIRSEFARAYHRIVVILGEGEEVNLRRRRIKMAGRKGKSILEHADREGGDSNVKPPLTILSAILTVRKGLYEYRVSVEELWERVRSGTVETGVDDLVWNRVHDKLKKDEEQNSVLGLKKHMKRKRDDGGGGGGGSGDSNANSTEPSREINYANRPVTFAKLKEVVAAETDYIDLTASDGGYNIPHSGRNSNGPNKHASNRNPRPGAKSRLFLAYESDSTNDHDNITNGNNVANRNNKEWKAWEKEYFNTIKEAAEENGFSPNSDMELESSSSSEDGAISDVETKGSSSKRPLKKKIRF
ncbi:hypothetical protein HK100_003014 [Physocladia obscura]|uniref:polynucleotide adenylyltransferase n=1 Tax=Physocladia obscura TaxID=109957 RepID=A0AAD5XDU3_9FUNG|nr:hypothetical protein HK100_003014 [Physocladia obscura]